MSTAVRSDIEQTEDQLLELQEQMEQRSHEAGVSLKEFIGKRRELRQAEDELNEKMAEYLGGSPSPAPVAASAPQKSSNGRKSPKASKASKSAAKSKTANKSKRSGYQNDKSLRVTIFEILDRPKNSDGLKVTDIADVIEEEDIWKTDKDLGKQVGSTVQALKKAGKIVRDGETGKYYVPDGVSL